MSDPTSEQARQRARDRAQGWYEATRPERALEVRIWEALTEAERARVIQQERGQSSAAGASRARPRLARIMAMRKRSKK